MTFGPLFVLALVFFAFAAFDWRRLPFCARASLAAATVFAIAGFSYPGADLAEVVEDHRDGLAYMVRLRALARVRRRAGQHGVPRAGRRRPLRAC